MEMTVLRNKLNLSKRMPNRFYLSVRYSTSVMLMCFLTLTYANDVSVPKLVYLIEEDDKLIASNIKFNRFDEIKLEAKETVSGHAVGNAVIVIVTNKRIIAYSVYTASWRTRGLEADEDVESINAEDYSALVVTSKRFLSFNGKNGVWAESQRSKIFR
jgi:hypothetical protein